MKMTSSLLCVFALLFVGVCNAETKTKFYENGQKNTEINYKDDKRHGLATYWTADGKVMTQIMWQDGEKVEKIKNKSLEL
jgi:antitoxin component YwqK of YwqJK toxin-antitoxin module